MKNKAKKPITDKAVEMVRVASHAALHYTLEKPDPFNKAVDKLLTYISALEVRAGIHLPPEPSKKKGARKK